MSAKSAILTKLFWHARLMAPRLHAPPLGMWMDHTHYAHALWRFYIDYAETLTGAEARAMTDMQGLTLFPSPPKAQS